MLRVLIFEHTAPSCVDVFQAESFFYHPNISKVSWATMIYSIFPPTMVSRLHRRMIQASHHPWCHLSPSEPSKNISDTSSNTSSSQILLKRIQKTKLELQESSKNHPKIIQKSSKIIQNHPKSSQNHPKSSKNYPKSSKIIQNHPKSSKIIQNHPKIIQNHPKIIQNHPKSSQNHPKSSKNYPKLSKIIQKLSKIV